MSRFTKIVAAFGAGSMLFLLAGQSANAQTPAQMEYERQQREYRQQQEQQRQDQQRLQQLQNDNARRQQEESNRAARQLAPSTTGPNYPSPSASPSSPAPSVGGRSAVPSTAASERRYALPGQRSFVVQIPGGWKDQIQQARDGSSPTIVLSPASGRRFEVLLTPTSSTAKDRAPESREDIRAAVERAAQGAKSWAAESQLPLKEIKGRSGPGFYFSATERAPKTGAHKFVTTGILRVGDRLVAFTILTHEGQVSVVGQALDLLNTAVLDSAVGTVAAPSARPASGTSAVNSPATHTLRLNSYYICNSERVAVLRCRSEADDAYCSVQYPDRKSAATGGVTPELAERRGELVKKLEQCQPPKS
jgi:hypothetical protein